MSGLRLFQIDPVDLHGTQAAVQASDGTGTNGNLPKFNADGSLTDSGIASGGVVPTTRLINTTAPLTGGGDLSADRTLAVSLATTSAVGVVKPDGTTITIDAAGKITAAAGTGGSSGTWVKEVPSGSLNGTNKSFTLSYTPVAGSLDLVCNIPQVEGTDFTISGNAITFAVAPKARDAGWLLARYQH